MTDDGGLHDGVDDLGPPPQPPPTLPGRAAYLLAFAATALAGVFGGIIGWGVTDIGCEGDCGATVTVGTLVGALGAAVGVGVVSALVLRAMAEWHRQQADAAADDDE